MARLIIVALVAAFAINTANCLMSQEEAKALAIQLSSFDADVIDRLAVDPQEDQLRSLTDIFGSNMDVPENSAANLKILTIESSIKSVKSVFNRYKDYEAKFRKLAKELRDVDAEMTKVHRQLYYDGETKLFDVLAYNKDPTTNCVTHASSVKWILQLFKSLMYAEIEITAIELYSRELQSRLGKPDNVTEAMIWGHFDNRTNNLRRVASDALDIATREMGKCRA